MEWKRVEDMTDEELLEMNEEKVERMVKLLMAEEGIPIYPPPEKPELAEVEPPDGEFFTFRLFDGIAFPTAEGIRDVVKLMQMQGCVRCVKEYNAPAGYHEPNILKARYGNEDEFDITSEKLYGRDAYKRSKAIIKENERREKEYEAELEKMKESRDAAQAFRDDIWRPIREAQNRKWECQQSETTFQEYLELAQKDAAQAWIFYEKAHKPQEHIEVYLREKFNVPAIEIKGDK
jgi:hypothetical protein